MKNTFSLLFILLVVFVSCKEEPLEEKPACLCLSFKHKIDNEEIVLNTEYYRNEAGNRYRMNEVKYFISSLHLYKNDGSKVVIEQDGGIHYVDMDYPSTLSWTISKEIPQGYYDSIGFTFGLNEKDNYSHRFLNPPQSNMSWSLLLGGGYHYMMMNGWYENSDAVQTPLNIHLGRGQIYQGTTNSIDSIIGFVDNYFHVNFPKFFRIKHGQTTDLTLIMNIENWFKEPFVYDFNYWGSHIMQKQPAMQMLKENGQNVFSAELKTEN